MKKLGSLRLGFSFAGCFLGAGYVSGQELWQFFGRFGGLGLLGLLLAVILLGVTGAAALRLSAGTGIAETDRLILGDGYPRLRWVIVLLETGLLFGVCVIMTAGVGALFRQLLGIPPWLAAAGFVVLVTATSFSGFRGMVAAFSATVPILVGVTLLFALLSLCKNGLTLPAADTTDTGVTLLRSWPVAAASFACYNIFGSIAIITPLSRYTARAETTVSGILIGIVLLLSVALSVLVCVSGGGVAQEELPMLALALRIAYPVGLGYGALLLLAMFGTCLSSFVAFLQMIWEKFPLPERHRASAHLLCALVMFFASLLGFGDLIGTIYPFFGYCSSVFIVILLLRCFRQRSMQQ